MTVSVAVEFGNRGSLRDLDFSLSARFAWPAETAWSFRQVQSGACLDRCDWTVTKLGKGRVSGRSKPGRYSVGAQSIADCMRGGPKPVEEVETSACIGRDTQKHVRNGGPGQVGAGGFHDGRGGIQGADVMGMDSDLSAGVADAGFGVSPTELGCAAASFARRALTLLASAAVGHRSEADQPLGLNVWGGRMVIFME